MFKGTETITVTSSAPPEQVYSKIESALRDLGAVKISKSGVINIDANKNLSNPIADVTLSGRVAKDPGGEYVVTIDYNVAPSMLNWIISAVLFLTTCGGGLFFLLAMIQKGPTVAAIKKSFMEIESKVQ